MSDDWPFCDCGVTLLDGEDECSVCADAPHERECRCDACDAYWGRIERESKAAAERANRALVCSSARVLRNAGPARNGFPLPRTHAGLTQKRGPSSEKRC